MAIGKDTALRLILIDDQANEAEAIVSSLRNAGIAVRPQRLEDLEALLVALDHLDVHLEGVAGGRTQRQHRQQQGQPEGSAGPDEELEQHRAAADGRADLLGRRPDG